MYDIRVIDGLRRKYEIRLRQKKISIVMPREIFGMTGCNRARTRPRSQLGRDDGRPRASETTWIIANVGA